MFFRFHVICNAVTLIALGLLKRETSENEAIALGFGTIVQLKENGVMAHSSGFLQTPAHSPLQCANIRRFVFPAKAPWSRVYDALDARDSCYSLKLHFGFVQSSLAN